MGMASDIYITEDAAEDLPILKHAFTPPTADGAIADWLEAIEQVAPPQATPFVGDGCAFPLFPAEEECQHDESFAGPITPARKPSERLPRVSTTASASPPNQGSEEEWVTPTSRRTSAPAIFDFSGEAENDNAPSKATSVTSSSNARSSSRIHKEEGVREQITTLPQKEEQSVVRTEQNETSRVWVASCLQCLMKKLPCNKTLPCCSRCKRPGGASSDPEKQSLCLAQGSPHWSMTSTPMLLLLKSDSPEMVETKIALQNELLEQHRTYAERANWAPSLPGSIFPWRICRTQLKKTISGWTVVKDAGREREVRYPHRGNDRTLVQSVHLSGRMEDYRKQLKADGMAL